MQGSTFCSKRLITAHPGRMIYPWQSYLDQYVRAADILFKSVGDGSYCVDTLVHPLMYLVSHSIELGLKLCIYDLQRTLKKSPSKENTHKLRELKGQYLDLRNEFIEHCDKEGINRSDFDADALKRSLEELISGKDNPFFPGLSYIDKQSQKFRYPCVKAKTSDKDSTKVDKPSFSWTDKLNLEEVWKLYKDAMTLLQCEPMVIGEMIGIHDE
jgi:hypothetical protein